jgi:predicted SnoaL-like aldol condensation-catalyzing enzyme
VESECNVVRPTRRTKLDTELASCASIVTGTTGDSKDAHGAGYAIIDTFRGDRAAIGEHADTCASERTSRGVD